MTTPGGEPVVTGPKLQSQVAAAEAYEGLHVPALFHQWAAPVLDAAGVRSGVRVLDVACGTGVLAREAVPRVGEGGKVVGIDPDPGMLTVAERLAPMVEWRQGTAESLPFEDATFEAVVSQFGLMFFRDRKGSISEMLRVLTPDGTVAVAVWESLERSSAYPEEVDLLQRLGGQAAADALRAPFVMGDTQELTELFEDAGASEVRISTRVGHARFPSVRSMVEADLRGWLPVMGVNLEEATIQKILSEAETTLSEYVTASGEVEFDSPAHVVTARKS